MELTQMITDYLASGGLFNPEAMEHDKVRDLLIACRNTIDALQARLDTATQILPCGHPKSCWLPEGIRTDVNGSGYRDAECSICVELKTADNLMSCGHARRFWMDSEGYLCENSTPPHCVLCRLDTAGNEKATLIMRLINIPEERETATSDVLRTALYAIDKCEAHADPPDSFDGLYYINKQSALANIQNLTPAHILIEAELRELEVRKREAEWWHDHFCGPDKPFQHPNIVVFCRGCQRISEIAAKKKEIEELK